MTNETNHAEEQAKAQNDSIAAMVASVGVDYERLADLRDDRTQYVDETGADDKQNDVQRADARSSWAAMNPEDAAELDELESLAGDCEDEDEARRRIQEDALSVEVRSDWHSVGEEMTAGEYRIVVCTGGPHVEIRGDLNGGTPTSARLMFQDWGTPLTEYIGADHESLLAYASEFLSEDF